MFTRCRKIIEDELLKSQWRYYKPFLYAKATNENKSADFAHFDLEIGCHGNIP